MSGKLLAPDFESDIRRLRACARSQRSLSADRKNAKLRELAEALVRESARVLAANAEDLARLPATQPAAFRDRLTLNEQRIAGMAESLRQVAALPDPVGEIVEQKILANGLKVRRVRAPLGVIFMVFESRPNVITEAFSLAYKSGNVILLRGGSESRATADVIYELMQKTLGEPPPFLGVRDYDRDVVAALLQRKDLIDITVPRGGEALIDFVQRTALMPIIKNDRGLCHTYVDDEADVDMAVKIVHNAKVQRPGVCNALETLLVHEKVASTFLPKLYATTESVGLQWHVDPVSNQVLKGLARVQPASEKDWDTEYLDLILNCRVVKNLDEALQHIERYGSKHSEAIVTANETKARRFQDEVDAAAVYWNASTRFTDGFELGLGGELGVSTQKLHVRGPVGLRELTTPRWIVDGRGQIR
ncbi:MAG: glutamate-5-semialdehyde dehydrogenase [Bdellovibrionales bacterium]|nr:glutamate-5-semialdehyde dehydrogenase [Bdellovibrionales bacterium]